MRLSEIMSRFGGSTMMISIALVMFFLIFLGVLLYTYVLLGKDTVHRFSLLPLEADGPISPSSSPAANDSEHTKSSDTQTQEATEQSK